MRIYVSQAWIDYVASLYGAMQGDPYYIREIDLNNDGEIDTVDIGLWNGYFGQFVEIGGTSDLLFFAGLGAAVFFGILIAKIL